MNSRTQLRDLAFGGKRRSFHSIVATGMERISAGKKFSGKKVFKKVEEIHIYCCRKCRNN